jgi:hypothetical protein
MTILGAFELGKATCHFGQVEFGFCRETIKTRFSTKMNDTLTCVGMCTITSQQVYCARFTPRNCSRSPEHFPLFRPPKTPHGALERLNHL